MSSSKKISIYVFYAGLFGLSISVSVSKFGTSLGMILLSLALLLEWNWEQKRKLFKKNKCSLILSASLFLIFLLGILNSDNIVYGLKDLKIKAPLLIIPVVFSLSEVKLNKKIVLIALILFSLAAIVASFIGFLSYQINLGKGVLLDLRTMSPYISLIRLSLILCFGFGFSLWGVSVLKSKYKWLLLIFNFWIIYFLVSAESLTGIVLLPIISIYYLLFVSKRDSRLAISLGLIVFGLAIWIGFELKEISTIVFANKKSEIKEFTLNGRKYSHYRDIRFRENGHLVYDNFCEEEMRQEWDKLSTKKYDYLFKDFNYGSILIRYLSSRGLSKDSIGVSKLSSMEVSAIQNGTTNVYYINRNPLFKRIHVAFMEVRDAYELKRYSGSSIASRFVYVTTGYQIFKDNFWFGVGTGDVKDAFLEQYKKTKLLQDGCDKKSHNQYVTTALSLGIVGIFLFIGILFLLIKNYSGPMNYLFILGQIIVLLSMLWEDTLETQAGVAVFGLLLNLFIFQKKADNILKT